MITNIVYSNNEYFYVLDIFIDEWNHYYNKDLIVFADTPYKNKKTITYNNNSKYTDRLIECLEQINNEIVLYQHEDMFLYDYPNQNKMNEYENILKNNKCSFIRLAKSEYYNFSKNNLNETLLNISSDSPYFFAVQSSLWKKNDLIEFLKQAGSLSIYDLEILSPIINSKINLQGLCHFDNEQKRGNHHDSSVWPYIATSIDKGKLNFLQYKIELEKIKHISNSQRHHNI